MTDVTDDFNRANGNLGANWTNDGTVSGVWTIVSNAAFAVNTNNAEGRAAYTGQTFENDQSAQITVTVLPISDGPGGGPSVRMGADTIGGYSVYATTSTLYLSKYGAADLATYSHTLLVGDVIKVSAVGSTIKGYLNGVEVMSGTDSTYTSGYPGLIGYRNTNTITVDDFVAGPIAGGGGSVVETKFIIIS